MIYEFYCPYCGINFVQKMTVKEYEKKEVKCVGCGYDEVKRVYRPFHFLLKGNWFKEEY